MNSHSQAFNSAKTAEEKGVRFYWILTGYIAVFWHRICCDFEVSREARFHEISVFTKVAVNLQDIWSERG